jgi:hypothetical protein
MHDDSSAIPFRDLSGRTFGRLTVMRFSHEPERNRRFWLCLCACGLERIVREDYIKTGSARCRPCRTLEIATRQGPRVCSACERMLTRDHFYKDRSTTDGLARHCKSCKRSSAAKRSARLRNRRAEDIPVPAEKRCWDCGLTKPSSDFWLSKENTDGLSRRCADCQNVYQRAWYERVGRARIAGKSRLQRYRLKESDLETLLANQGGKCAICGVAFEGDQLFQLDHDHATGKLRDALCPSCNSGLGAFHDSVETMRSAITYLQRHAAT